METISDLQTQAAEYTRNYSKKHSVTDPEAFSAIYYSHLAFLINQESRRLAENYNNFLNQ